MTNPAVSRMSTPGLLCLFSLAGSLVSLRAQSVPLRVGSPVYNGFQVPKVRGTLNYSVSASERITRGYYGGDGTQSATSFAGNVAFITPSVRHPFSLTYSGGYLQTTSGEPSSFFHNLTLTQQLELKQWTMSASDSVSYLPQTASAGLSGVPGVGDLGAGGGGSNFQGVLTPYATRVSNSASASISRKLTGKTSADGTGSYSLQRFVGSASGIQTDNYSGGGGITHRINALSSWAAGYRYSSFSYVNVDGSFDSQGAGVTYKRQISRRLSAVLGGGPERISGSTLTGRGPSLTYAADASLSYTGSVEHAQTYNVSYTRSTNGGSGVTFGATSDTFSASASRRLMRSLQGSALFTYGRSSGLQLVTSETLNTQSTVGSVQVNRAFWRTVSAFGSYTAQQQTTSGGFQGISPLNGISQVLGFGVTYSPSSMRLGRQ